MMLLAAFLIDLGGTLITLEPASDPAALAEVHFFNKDVNGAHHNGTYPLADADLSMDVKFVWDAGQQGEDMMVVIPPPGVVCVPESCTALVKEGYTGVVILYDWRGM